MGDHQVEQALAEGKRGLHDDKVASRPTVRRHISSDCPVHIYMDFFFSPPSLSLSLFSLQIQKNKFDKIMFLRNIYRGF